MKVLFICNQNENRSKTAEELFQNKFETKSAGLFNETPLTSEQLDWADLVVVMEDIQRTILSERFPKQYLSKQIVCLNIPDIFHYNQPELITLLKQKMDNVLLATH